MKTSIQKLLLGIATAGLVSTAAAALPDPGMEIGAGRTALLRAAAWAGTRASRKTR